MRVKTLKQINYKQLYDFMPDQTFRMLICAPSGSGKTNTLLFMLYNLLYFDKIYLYAMNLEQSKYKDLLKIFDPISKESGYDIIETSNDKITPLYLNLLTLIKRLFFSTTTLYVKRTKGH